LEYVFKKSLFVSFPLVKNASYVRNLLDPEGRGAGRGRRATQNNKLIESKMSFKNKMHRFNYES
jgi:hypothetical protein